MLQIPVNDQGHNRSPSNQQVPNNSREYKNIEIKNQKTNFLYDVIMPNTLDIQNMRIIQKHARINSPESISKKIIQMKKSKIQKKIQSIVTKNSQDAQKSINNVPKATKYTKQNIKRESKFAQNEKYKKFIFQQQIPVQKMKLVYGGFTSSNDKENTFSPIKRISQSNNWMDDFVQEQKISPFVIQMDEKLAQKRKMQEEVFEPFKQKIRKVIDKTINTGVNGKVNTLMEKVNFYLTSISEMPSKPKIKKITVDIQTRDIKVKSYCEQIQKGTFIRSLKENKRNQNYSEMKQYRSHTSLVKNRPFTAGVSARSVYSTKEKTFVSNSRAISSSRLNRYSKSTAEFNIKTTPSKTQRQRKYLGDLLDEIQSTCWQSQFDNKIIQRRMSKMSNQWEIDGEGKRIYENKRMDMTQETLQMIKKIRMRASKIQQVENQLMENDQ